MCLTLIKMTRSIFHRIIFFVSGLKRNTKSERSSVICKYSQIMFLTFSEFFSSLSFTDTLHFATRPWLITRQKCRVFKSPQRKRNEA